MNEWPVHSFGNAPLQMIDGDRGKNYPNGTDFAADGYCLFLSARNVTKSGFLFEETTFVSADKDASLRAGKLLRGDVVLTTRGTVGNVAYFDEAVPFENMRVNSGMLILRPDPARLDPRYLYYFLRSDSMAQQIESLTSGSAQPQLPVRDLSNATIPVPGMHEQHAIAEVLGALDDKIAANSKLTQTIDNYFMARWSALPANDSLEQVKLTELVGDVIGGDWGTSESAAPSTEEVLCIRGADIADLQGSGLGSMPRRFIKPNSLRRRKLAHMDLVVEMSGGSPTQSTGRVVLITNAMLKRLPLPLSSSNFCRIVRLSNHRNAFFVYALLRESWTRGEFFQFENGSTGIKNLAFADFCATKEVRMPGLWRLQEFNRLADGLFSQMQSLGEESARLMATRDALLPQLMSGKLRVKEAEALVAAAV
ncbi:restriction endonuclease subunit S [Arthrobacter sp. ISL-5]|uniref:restriction endonuclease subunit S n=1 Tax=Arthrobacter sp. ISL-5 TaxID=2819111 RepID=UPI001BEBB1E5|nr:restriction endonuclease subunit S [Arthrobacter sp. ISL-5]MBT2555825.1 restriction endonuclease subunit S [Arthrobacter sp. ISL-5]